MVEDLFFIFEIKVIEFIVIFENVLDFIWIVLGEMLVVRNSYELNFEVLEEGCGEKYE